MFAAILKFFSNPESWYYPATPVEEAKRLIRLEQQNIERKQLKGEPK